MTTTLSPRAIPAARRASALYCATHGSGTPLLLVHGLGVSGAVFEPLLPTLSARYQTVVPDLRGHGQSRRLPSPDNIERLAADPATFIVGLEIRLKWASLVDERVRASGHGNRGRVFAEDVRLALPRFGEGSLSRVFIHFPDPWWKKRHKKRRVMNDAFLKNVERTLVGGGRLHFWTDVEEYFQSTLEFIAATTSLHGPLTVAEQPAEHDLDYRTHFERRTRKSELPVYRAEFRK